VYGMLTNLMKPELRLLGMFDHIKHHIQFFKQFLLLFNKMLKATSYMSLSTIFTSFIKGAL